MKNEIEILKSLSKEINECDIGLFARHATLESDSDEIILVKKVKEKFVLTQHLNYRCVQEKTISKEAFQNCLNNLVEIGVGQAPNYEEDAILDGEILTIILKHPNFEKTLFNSYFYGEFPEDSLSKKVINGVIPIVHKLLQDK